MSLCGEKKKTLLTQKKISVPGRGFCDWEKIRSARLDGREVVSDPKICNLFFRYVLSIELFRKAIPTYLIFQCNNYVHGDC